MPGLKILTSVGYYLPGYKAGGPLRTLANMVDKLGMMGKVGRKEFLSKYSWKLLIEQYETLFNKLNKQNKRSVI